MTRFVRFASLTDKEDREPARNASLDGLRGVAVACVLIHHWTEWGPRFGFGQIGVQTFFVISGFLITGILLAPVASGSASRFDRLIEIRSFFARRALRIFPIYYLLLGAIYFSDRFGIASSFNWHASYLSNAYFFRKGEFEGSLSHLWSLSVEEQFYLFWPWLVLFTSRRWLGFVVCCLILLAPIARVSLYSYGYSEFAQYNTLVFSNLDSLGCGALLALARTVASPFPRNRVVKGGSYLGYFVGLAMILVSRLLGQPGLSVATDQLALAIIVTSLIEAITAGKGKHTARILSTSPLVYVGRISYGIYLYHMFAPNFLNALKAPEFLRHGPLGFLVMMLTTLFVASASWFAIERPINSFKHCFPYFRTRPINVL